MASNESTRGEEPGNDRSTASNNTSAHSDNAPGEVAAALRGVAHTVEPALSEGELQTIARAARLLEEDTVEIPRSTAHVAHRELELLIGTTEDQEYDPLTEDVFRARDQLSAALSEAGGDADE